GASFGAESSASSQVASLEVFPKIVTLERGGSQRLLLTAHFVDGHTEDFTDSASYKSNDNEVATVAESGVVRAARTGETAILIHAAGQAAALPDQTLRSIERQRVFAPRMSRSGRQAPAAGTGSRILGEPRPEETR